MDDPIDPMALHERATAAGLTISEMCDRAGVAVSTFHRWKRGANRITVDNYKRLRAVVADAEQSKKVAAE
jgi:transcriptional regulator with XRE-family HTH domain